MGGQRIRSVVVSLALLACLTSAPAWGESILGAPTSEWRGKLAHDRGLPGAVAFAQSSSVAVYNGLTPSRRATGSIANPTNPSPDALNGGAEPGFASVQASGFAQEQFLAGQTTVTGPLGRATASATTPFASSELTLADTRYWRIESDTGDSNLTIEDARVSLHGWVRSLAANGIDAASEASVLFTVQQVGIDGDVDRELLALRVQLDNGVSVSTDATGLADARVLADSVNPRDAGPNALNTWDITYYETFLGPNSGIVLPVGPVFGLRMSASLRSHVSGTELSESLAEAFVTSSEIGFALTAEQRETTRLIEVRSVPEPSCGTLLGFVAAVAHFRRFRFFLTPIVPTTRRA